LTLLRHCMAPCGVACTSVSPMRCSAPDVVMRGRLRSLGRLLQTVGERLIDAAVGTAESRMANEAELRSCGHALRAAAEALLRESWTEAELCLGHVAGLDCGAILPNEHLAALRALVDGSSEPLDARAALMALGRALEERAEGLGDAWQASQDAFIDAAGALRAGARLFNMPRANRPHRAAAASAAAGSSGGTASRPRSASRFVGRSLHSPALLSEIQSIMADPSSAGRKAKLRTLAKRYHPDQHPGREMEVLPTFLHIQRLRDDERSWTLP